MAKPVSESCDWAAIYKSVQDKAKIPGTAKQTAGTQFIYRDMLVKLDDVLVALAEAAIRPVMIFVYADVVQMPTERNWLLDNVGLFIATRRIEADTGSYFQLDYRSKNNGQLVVYAAEVKGPLQVKVFTTAGGRTKTDIVDLSQFDALGVQVLNLDGALVRKDLTYIGEEALVLGGELWLALSCIFQFATVLMESRPEIAAAMLRWIQASTAPSTVAKDMYLQAATFLSQLALSSGTVNFVPYLSKNVYEESAQGFEDAALQYEAQYQIFYQEKEDKSRWLDAAGQMQKYFGLTGDFNRQLITQASDNLNNAQQAVDEAAKRLN